MIMVTQSEISGMRQHDGRSLGTRVLGPPFVHLGKSLKPQKASYLTSASEAEK